MHCLAILIPLHFDTTPDKDLKENVLYVELKPKEAKPTIAVVEQAPKDKAETQKRLHSVTENLNDNEPEINRQPSTSLSTIELWVQQESKRYLDQREKIDLSKLRKDSYTEKWLDPDRVDTRDSDQDKKIRTTDGLIWVSKAKGRLVCTLVTNDGNVKTFNCGDPILNVLLDKSGAIKNSDRYKWHFDD